ncbi:MAG: DUF2630 family protein [Dehalococcoidia bacterium]
MDDKDLLATIQRLVDEEHALLEETNAEAAPERHERLDKLEVQLDQCWDLLRQRRGRRHAGQDPDTARVRDPNTVERYVQ